MPTVMMRYDNAGLGFLCTTPMPIFYIPFYTLKPAECTGASFLPLSYAKSQLARMSTGIKSC